ncbi:MAG TPA: polysaccharide deacetylase family protein [Thermoanaerobaculia bacterium]|nr:polysaccharide deacetylase family protein [Thermoanaerobaculia bacterium]
MPSTCFRHPEKTAKRKCFHCRRVICMACYVQKSGHIFCSERCRWTSRAKEIRGSLGRRAQRPVPALLFAAILLAAVVPIGLVLGRAAQELDSSILPFHRERVREVALTAEILSIDEGEETVTIRGRTAPGALAFLLEQGTVVATLPAADDGSFRFERPIPDAETQWSVAAAASQLAEASFAPRPKAAVPPPQISVRSGSARFVESYTRGSMQRPEIVLSFDAGSSSRGTAEILDVLRAHDVRTTVFLTGEFIEREPDLVRRIVAEGHEVGNHTWSHPHLTTFARNRNQTTLRHVTRDYFLDQLRRTEEAFVRVAGRRMAPYWRAPFGEENSEIRGWAEEAGYLHVGWTRGRRSNLDALDWVSDPDSPIYYDPQALTRRLMKFGEANNTTLNGGIVLMHLGSDREAAQRLDRALPELIAGLRAQGLTLVSVSEMRRGGRQGPLRADAGAATTAGGE